MPQPPDTDAAAPVTTGARVSTDRLPDLGPAYIETPPDPYTPDAPLVAEPWNTVTASFFIWIALAWLWKVRGRYREFPFLVCCLPILLAGGIGGTLFHGTRRSRWFFLLDVVPIQLLGLAGAAFMAYRFLGRRRLWVLLLVVPFYVLCHRLIFSAIGPQNRHRSINLSYASLAPVVLAPVLLVLWRTRFRHGGWVVAGAISFAIGWFFRLYDQHSAEYLPMGCHWLWHTFGALSTAAMIQFFYKVEGDAPPDGAPVSVRVPN
ncbi:MAG TPA: hypothetical protein VGE74_09745 [Gemmata sp.]